MGGLLAVIAVLAMLPQASVRSGPPSLADACYGDSGVRATPLWLETADHVRLYAIDAGKSSTVAVLAHEGGSDLCQELPYIHDLVAAGLGVVAFDFRGYGRSATSSRHPLALGQDLAAAVAHAHAEGAKHVFLIGASMGGAAVVNNSGALPVDGLISLSGTILWRGYGINLPGARALRAPLLYIGSRSDWRAPVQQALAVVHRAGSKDKRVVLYRGSLHGWDLVQAAAFAAKTRALILNWIRRHS